MGTPVFMFFGTGEFFSGMSTPALVEEGSGPGSGSMLNENEVQLASLAVREIRVAVAHSLLHPFGSPPVRRAIEKAFLCLHELLLLRPRITLDFEGERPRVEQSNLEEGVVDSTHVLYEILQSHEIRKITFTQGLTDGELTRFFALLKPRFLPDEKTALQSLLENPIPNVGINELEPVSLSGTIPGPPAVPPDDVPAPAGPASITFDVSAPLDVLPETDEEVRGEEAEAALDRFLEVVGDIDSEKLRENLIQRLSEKMNATPETANRSEAGPNADWKKLTAEIFTLRDELPTGSKLQQRMDGILKKWPDTLRDLPSRNTTRAVPSVPQSVSRDESQNQIENPSQLLNPAREAESDATLKAYLAGHQIERIIPAWVVLWNGVFSGAESIQALCLRHLSRLNWTRLPRPLQVEGFSYLDNFLKAHWSESLRLSALDRLDAWLRLERNAGHWETLLSRSESFWTLVADASTPAALKTKAKTYMKSLFPHDALESNYQKLGTSSDEQARLIFRSAGPLATAFLREHLVPLDPASIDETETKRLALLVHELESVGEKPLERLLDRLPGERGARVLFALAQNNPFPPSLVEPLRAQLAQYSIDVRRQALTLAETSDRKDLQGWAIELLGDADLDIVRRALKLLTASKMEGVSRLVVAMLETREFPTKDARDSFWIEACQALGDIGDTRAIKPLTDWAQSYGVLEKRKEKPVPVRRAAIQALGRFQRDYVKTFLEKLINEGDPAIIDAASEAHEQVTAKLEQSPERVKQPS